MIPVTYLPPLGGVVIPLVTWDGIKWFLTVEKGTETILQALTSAHYASETRVSSV